MRRGSHLRTAGGLLVLLLLAAGRAEAQAWLPPKGGGAVSLTLGDYAFDGHFDADGSRDPYGGTRAKSVWVEGTYAITNRLAVSAGLPFVATKFSGTFPEGVPLGPLDKDRRYHGDFQDFRGELAWNAIPGDFALTPFAGVGLPSHEYEYRGEAVPGKDLKEAYLGAAAGRSFAPFLPKAYLHARYSYAFVEKKDVDVKTLNRSNLDGELGFEPARRLLVRALVRWQKTHGGLDLADMRDYPNLFRDHDRAARTNYLNLGAGASFALDSSWDLYLVFIKTVSGENAHQARSLSIGATWYFGGGFGGKGGK
jgi:hypothetical protein